MLVGHSYGGAVITNAAVGADNVKALVYIAAFALEEGENAAAATALGSDGPPPDLTQVVDIRPFPDAGEGNGDAYLKVEIFPQTFCQDLPAELAAAMAAAQRPAALATLVEPSGPPAWKTVPSWYLVASEDRVIPPGAERVMSARAGLDRRRDRQLARRDDQPPRRGHRAHPAGDRRGRLTSGEPDHALVARNTGSLGSWGDHSDSGPAPRRPDPAGVRRPGRRAPADRVLAPREPERRHAAGAAAPHEPRDPLGLLRPPRLRRLDPAPRPGRGVGGSRRRRDRRRARHRPVRGAGPLRRRLARAGLRGPAGRPGDRRGRAGPGRPRTAPTASTGSRASTRPGPPSCAPRSWAGTPSSAS